MGRLTTHVLDTTEGVPAADLQITLWSLDAHGERSLLKMVHTNADGRVDGPLLEGDDFRPGIYELIFSVGAYFWARGVHLPDPAFIDEVPLRFGVADAGGHWHVPLLVSPYGYSTYRGS